jgi:hypothetical protein
VKGAIASGNVESRSFALREVSDELRFLMSVSLITVLESPLFDCCFQRNSEPKADRHALSGPSNQKRAWAANVITSDSARGRIGLERFRQLQVGTAHS